MDYVKRKLLNRFRDISRIRTRFRFILTRTVCVVLISILYVIDIYLLVEVVTVSDT